MRLLSVLAKVASAVCLHLGIVIQHAGRWKPFRVELVAPQPVTRQRPVSCFALHGMACELLCAAWHGIKQGWSTL